jgi:hypothetical protein
MKSLNYSNVLVAAGAILYTLVSLPSAFANCENRKCRSGDIIEACEGQPGDGGGSGAVIHLGPPPYIEIDQGHGTENHCCDKNGNAIITSSPGEDCYSIGVPLPKTKSPATGSIGPSRDFMANPF